MDAHTEIRGVGSLEVIALLDTAGPFFEVRDLAFPGATDDDWERARSVDPAAFGPDGEWQLVFRCFAIRDRRGRVTLVDAGAGPEGSPAAAWVPVPGQLPGNLDAAGISTGDVDLVVLTHLHDDHYGWSVGPDGTPMFPNARYVVQRAELAALPADNACWAYAVEPLRKTGQLDEIDGLTELAGGPDPITALPTPGHTAGHQSVLVEGGEQQIVITGDVLVHAVQLVNPGVAYLYERDKPLARETRQDLLAIATDHRALLATAHLTRPFVPVAGP